MGLAAMLVMSEIVFHVRHFRGLTLLGMALGIGALILPLAFGEWNNGAKELGVRAAARLVQPNEIVKLSVVLALAYFFSAHQAVWQMMPALLFAAACLLLLMMQRDLGTALIYYLTTLVLFYVACGNVAADDPRPRRRRGRGGAGLSDVRARPGARGDGATRGATRRTRGYQIIQALLAIGSGGLFGVGLGQGTPENSRLLQRLYLRRGLRAAWAGVRRAAAGGLCAADSARGDGVARARLVEMLLGCGVLAMLGIQTFMIVAGVIKMIPLTGVTMPFLSYGGSSLLSCMAMIGILHGRAQGRRKIWKKIFCA